MQVALLWLLNESGEVLFSQRADSMDSDAGVWGPSVSGTVEVGESGLETSIREAKEELSLVLKESEVNFLFDISYLRRDGSPRDFNNYWARIPSTAIESFVLRADEVNAVKWMTIEAIRDFMRENPEKVVVGYATDLWNTLLSSLEGL